MCGGGRSWLFGFGGCGTGHFDQPNHRSYTPERLSDRELIQNEVRKLYAEGTIERGQYYDILARLDRGLFTWDDLAHLQVRDRERELTRIKPRKEPLPVTDSSEVGKLEAKKQEIHKAKEQINSLVTEIRQNNDRLQEQMALEEKLAEEMLAVDEQKARNHLMCKQELIEQSTHLETRLKELTSDLKQLEGLELKVEAKILEIKALSQREKIMTFQTELS